MHDDDSLVNLDLTDEERRLLYRGLVEWGGGAHCTEEMAIGMGFDSYRDFALQSSRLIAELKKKSALSAWDWTRALLATEIVFISDVVGIGSEWSDITDLDDTSTFHLIRSLQGKMLSVRVQVGSRPLY